MKVEITEWWDFKERLRHMSNVVITTVHITTRMTAEDIMNYRIANILSVRTNDGVVYTVVGSVFGFDKLKKEVERLGIKVRDGSRPMDYAYAYGVHLRREVIKKLAEINKEAGMSKIRVVTGFYGNPEWIKELMRWV